MATAEEAFASISRVDVGVYRSPSSSSTEVLGKLLGSVIEAGDVIILGGDLGAGKTCFTGGIAQSLGDKAPVTSPTFAVMQVHDGGRLPLYHCDVYRLEDVYQLEDTGIVDVLESDGVCVIEWGDLFPEAFGEERLDIAFAREGVSSHDETQEPARILRCTPHGERAEQLLRAFDGAVEEYLNAGAR